METNAAIIIGQFHAPGVWLSCIIGAVLALALCAVRVGKTALQKKTCLLFSVLAVLLGVFFSHFFYCLMRFDHVINQENVLSFLTFWKGGFMMYGGVAGVMIAAWLSCRCKASATLQLWDAIAPAGALMIAVARIAEGFSGQGYGEYLYEEGFFCRFPFAIFDPYYEFWAWNLYLPEALWAILLCAVLLCLSKKAKEGDRALLLLGLYAAAQVLFESLRRDDYLRWGFVRCSEVLSAVVLLIVLLCYHIRSGKGHALRKILCWCVFALMIFTCLMLEFATEKRAPMLTFLNRLDIGGCYAVMAGCCALLAGCVLCMRGAEAAQTRAIER